MVCNFLYLNQSKQWISYGKIVRPLSFGDTIKNETSTAYPIRLYFQGENQINIEELKPGTICRINFETKQYDYVVIDGGKIEGKTGIDYCYHSYSIQELLEYTREVYIDNAIFSRGQYTLEEFLERLLALSDTYINFNIDTNYDYDVLQTNYSQDEFQITSNSLLDNLIKFGQRYNVRVKAKYNDSNNQIDLYFVSLKGNDEITINGTLVNKTNQYMGANIASRVMAQINNVTNDNLSWYPHQDAAKGVEVSPEGDATTIEPNSAVLKYPYKLKNANKVKVAGYGNFITNSVNQWPGYDGQDYRVFDKDGNRIYGDTGKYVNISYDNLTQGNYIELPVYAYDRWKILDVNGDEGAVNHQENTLYFKPEENKIYNIKICDGDSSKFDNNYIGYVELWYGGALISTDYIYPILIWYKNKYIANVSFYIDALISFENEEYSKRTTLYTQEDNIINADSLLYNLDNYISSMKNKDNAFTYRFDSISDLPVPGSIYNGMIISQIAANAYYDKIEATITLSDDVVKKSEYLSADSGLNLSVVDINKAYNRYKIYKSKAWFCKNFQEADEYTNKYDVDTYYNITDYGYLLANPIINERTSPPISLVEAHIKLGNVYTSIEPNTITAHNSIISTFKTINSIIVGYNKNKSLGDDYGDIRVYPIAFSNGTKQKEINLSFKTIKSNNSNYPAISTSEFYNELGEIINIRDDNYHHDPNECINMSYMIDAKTSYKNGFVNKYYWEDSGLLADFYSTPDIYSRRYTVWSDDFALFGEHVLIDSVDIDYISDKIMRVRIYIPDENIPEGFIIPANQDGTYIVIDKVNTTTSDYFSMLKTYCEIELIGEYYYVTYYIALTAPTLIPIAEIVENNLSLDIVMEEEDNLVLDFIIQYNEVIDIAMEEEDNLSINYIAIEHELINITMREEDNLSINYNTTDNEIINIAMEEEDNLSLSYEIIENTKEPTVTFVSWTAPNKFLFQIKNNDGNYVEIFASESSLPTPNYGWVAPNSSVNVTLLSSYTNVTCYARAKATGKNYSTIDSAVGTIT